MTSTRRQLLLQLAALPALAQQHGPRTERPRMSDYPFSLGVASGEPSPDGFVLWTRLAPKPLEGGGMPQENVSVDWQVSADEAMTKIVAKGRTVGPAELSHSVHVEVGGLEPGRWYHYRFRAAGEISPVGRVRTAPSADAELDRFRFAFASCQHWETGYYTAYKHMAGEDLDLVVHLGDYIYEGPAGKDRVRQHNSDEIVSLADYRNRHALYRSDPDLQAAHAAFPWVVTWDDHEVDNNYADRISEQADVTVDDFLTRRAYAYQAYYEHMPLGSSTRPRGHDMRIYRRLRFGRLAEMNVLDTRQYRSDQSCGDRNKPACEGVFDPKRTLLGAEQRDWLFDGLKKSEARWNILAQQVMMARADRVGGEEVAWSMDQWGGYDAERTRVLTYLAESRIANPVVLTGDIHSNWVNNLHVDFDRPESAVVATEFVGTSISSGGDGAEKGQDTDHILAENPFVKMHNRERGYVSCELTPERWRANYQVVPYVSRRGAPLITRAKWATENGRPGVVKA